jgi:hypothetical protein
LFSREELGNWVKELCIYLGSEEEEDDLGEELRRGKKGGRTRRSRVEID